LLKASSIWLRSGEYFSRIRARATSARFAAGRLWRSMKKVHPRGRLLPAVALLQKRSPPAPPATLAQQPLN
jgi:hypothetical protein